MPGAADREAYEAVKSSQPAPAVYPHAYSWYAMVSKFSPAKQAEWK